MMRFPLAHQFWFQNLCQDLEPICEALGFSGWRGRRQALLPI
jgi:hypothetical protein